jgi:hypothetical protein
MKYFLMVYDRAVGKLIELRSYEEEQIDQALVERFNRELDERQRPNVEVVLLSASSLEAVKRTHARYFKTAGELAASAHSSAASV